MKTIPFIALPPLLLFIGLMSCGSQRSSHPTGQPEIGMKTSADLAKYQKAYFASGCFWCVEAIFESVRGVEEAVSGYSGGKEANPTYEQVSSGRTGHAEAVEVYYDPELVSYATLVEVFYGSHDPTTVDGQAPDFGRQYRSMILYQNEEEKKIAEDYKAKLEASGKYNKPIATEIVSFEKFWDAEDYHQDYERKNPNQPYVRSVSIPRLKKFQAKYPELLKEAH
jgi:peptide-methionine (S)-S-oxide reductase